MNLSHAKILAETLTRQQIMDMLNNAQEQITDWTQPSKVNLSATIGTTWNILTHELFFPSNVFYNEIATSHRVNLIREFGDYLPTELKIKTVQRDKETDVELVHQEPKFSKKESQ